MICYIISHMICYVNVMLYKTCYAMLYNTCHAMLYNTCHAMLYNTCHAMLYNTHMICYVMLWHLNCISFQCNCENSVLFALGEKCKTALIY